MEIDASDLLLFARVMEAGSFSGAADRSGLPKSTVSRRVAALERRLGEKLVQRTTRKLALTEFGQTVLAHARAVAAEVEATEALALHRQATPVGRLRVSMPGDFAAFALAPALAKFSADHPLVSLEIDLSPRRVDLIAESVDVAIRMGALPDDAQLAARRLAVFNTGLYASPEYLRKYGEPVTPEALSTMHALMMLSRAGEPVPWQLTRVREATEEHWSGELRERTSANSPDLLLRLARAGAGIAPAANFFTEPYVRAGELVRVLSEWRLPPATAWAVFPGRKLLPTKSRAFIEALAEALAPCNEIEAARARA